MAHLIASYAREWQPGSTALSTLLSPRVASSAVRLHPWNRYHRRAHAQLRLPMTPFHVIRKIKASSFLFSPPRFAELFCCTRLAIGLCTLICLLNGPCWTAPGLNLAQQHCLTLHSLRNVTPRKHSNGAGEAAFVIAMRHGFRLIIGGGSWAGTHLISMPAWKETALHVVRG